MIETEILVAGGGMVGACFALALAQQTAGRLPITVVDPHGLASPPANGFDPRVSAITEASRRLFVNLGVWDTIQGERVQAYQRMVVWDQGGSGSIQFDAAELGEPSLGLIVENSVIQGALWSALERQPGVSLLHPDALEAFQNTPQAVQATTREGRRIRARLLVAADGANSGIRQQAGIATRGWPYGQKAVVTTVHVGPGHQDTAWQRFLEDGILAFLPLPRDHCSIVWSTSSEHADRLLTLSDEAFLGALSEAIEYRFEPLQSSGPRAAFPLRLQHAEHYVQPRLALIGDAAHAIHPLAGRGVNLGLLDAAALAQCLAQRHADVPDGDPGALPPLRRYERWRKGDNLLMMSAMDGIYRLFSSRSAPIRALRNLGLTLTDRLPGAKPLIARQAMGLGGDLPDGMRPGTTPAGQLNAARAKAPSTTP